MNKTPTLGRLVQWSILAAALLAGMAPTTVAGGARAQGRSGGARAAAAAPSPGRPAPSFALVDVDTGALLSNDALAGRWVLVDFWATWCGPCVAAVPYLEEAHAAFSGYDFDILSISLDGNAAVVSRFRRRRSEMPWLHALPDGGMASAVARAFGVRGIPSYFLIAPDGTIVATGSALHAGNLATTLQRFLFSASADGGAG